MVRIPPRETGKRAAPSLEKKITLLIGLSGLQVVILLIILVMQLIGGGPRVDDAHRAGGAGAPDEEAAEMSDAAGETADGSPVVEEPEVGSLPPMVNNERYVRIVVLNSTSIGGLAAHYKEVLRGMDYDVRDTGNAGQRYGSSVIVYGPDMRKHALRLALSMGMSNEQVRVGTGADQSVDTDLTLILGQDYQSLNYSP